MAQLHIWGEKEGWKDCLQTHNISDVYYRFEYVKPMADHLNAKPILIEYQGEDGGFIYCLLVMDIANDAKFSGLIPRNTYYDAETPYGYGGPFFWGEMDLCEDSIKQCQSLLREKMCELGIITQFIRFYPLMFVEGKSTIITDRFGTYKSTIYMDLENADTVMLNLDSQYRRKVRKAIAAGVSIEHDKGDQIEHFVRLYNMTMKMHNADGMYFFGEEYYDSLIRDFYNNLEVFYARIGERIVGASIFLYDEEFMHFHLGGRDVEVSSVPFENLLMVEAAKWGVNRGIKKLHIGGGLSDEDSLYQYKKKFNRSGVLPFYIGRSIFDENKYTELMTLRADSDKYFDPNNRFYIQYRF